MSTHPSRLEARVSAQERQQVILNARIEELAQDMDTSFKQLASYQVATEGKIDARFNQLEKRLDKIDATMATKKDLAGIATKEDLAAMESRILDTFKQLLTMINPTQPQ